MENTEKQIDGFLKSYPADLVELAQALRDYLQRETKPAFELVGQSTQSLNIGYGFTTTAWDCYCAIIVYRKHINISLPSGAALPDPKGLLHGTGSRVRHLKIQQLNDLKTAAAKKILKEARKDAWELLQDRTRDHEGVKTVIKTAKSKKKQSLRKRNS
ncbi:MAG: hypothetical protein HKN47_25105 [Pirellulaceae bacterium]|nr:hypothetical protein [Pirellulaceae bacterium]